VATVTPYKRELERGELPSVCMGCGEPASLIKNKRFSWGPGWVMALLIVGAVCVGPLFWVAFILIPFFLKRMLVPVPLCERHRNHWLPLQILLFGGIAVVAVLLCLTITLIVIYSGARSPRWELVLWSGYGTIGFLVAMIFPAAVLQTRVIRPIEITDQRITLANVAKDFVFMVQEKRSGPPDVLPVIDV
jgi:phosphoglycerol transferase MdoB-like AlkP superfamily enzyme